MVKVIAINHHSFGGNDLIEKMDYSSKKNSGSIVFGPGGALLHYQLNENSPLLLDSELIQKFSNMSKNTNCLILPGGFSYLNHFYTGIPIFHQGKSIISYKEHTGVSFKLDGKSIGVFYGDFGKEKLDLHGLDLDLILDMRNSKNGDLSYNFDTLSEKKLDIIMANGFYAYTRGLSLNGKEAQNLIFKRDENEIYDSYNIWNNRIDVGNSGISDIKYFTNYESLIKNIFVDLVGKDVKLCKKTGILGKLENVVIEDYYSNSLREALVKSKCFVTYEKDGKICNTKIPVLKVLAQSGISVPPEILTY